MTIFVRPTLSTCIKSLKRCKKWKCHTVKTTVAIQKVFLENYPSFIKLNSSMLCIFSKKPMLCENQSGFGGSSTDGTLTSTDSNVSNKDGHNGTLNSTDSNTSSRAHNITHNSPLDVFGLLQNRVSTVSNNVSWGQSQNCILYVKCYTTKFWSVSKARHIVLLTTLLWI